jgi:3-phenylpropionate/cinnamic acid dioxygenase small subunit
VGGTCGTNTGEEERVFRLLVGKPERKRPPGRPRHRRIYNIKMDLLEIGLNVVD